MNNQLRSRLKRLEAQNMQARKFIFRIAIVRRLPYDFVGERHMVPVEKGLSDTLGGGLCDFEEQPGPAPRGSHHDATLTYISEEDAML
jgi:hypothetical protein